MDILFLLIGLVVGSLATYYIAKFKYQQEVSKSEERSRIYEDNYKNISSELNSERTKVLELNSNLSSLQTDYTNVQLKLEEQKEEINQLQQKFIIEFENLANKILEEKSSKFTLQNKENLDQILKPLGEKIKEFEKKVNEVYVTDSKERASLSEQLRSLRDFKSIDG